MVILFVKFRSALPPEHVRAIMDQRAEQFRALPGLRQKYYAHEATTGEWCGIYFWESAAELEAFRASELARSIPGAYQVEGTPRMEVLDIIFPLRTENR